MINIGAKVIISEEGRTGTVRGLGWWEKTESNEIRPCYLIRLDEGFWSKDGPPTYVSLISAHPDNVKEILP
jgi:hypothetical protein